MDAEKKGNDLLPIIQSHTAVHSRVIVMLLLVSGWDKQRQSSPLKPVLGFHSQITVKVAFIAQRLIDYKGESV